MIEPLRSTASGSAPFADHHEFPRIAAFRFRTSHRTQRRIRRVVRFRNPITSVS